MKNWKIVIGMMIAVMVISAACKKSEETKTAGTNKSVTEKKLDGTYWVREYSRPTMTTESGFITSYYGLAFKDGDKVDVIEQRVFKFDVIACEYEYKSGEGRLYRGTKKDFEDGIKEMKEFYKMEGEKKSDQELRKEMEEMAGVSLKFKVANDALILSGDATNFNPRVGESEYKKATLEEMQIAFKGYGSN
jgi:major membrane immunogen (membrane-anchored lipoprotein)